MHTLHILLVWYVFLRTLLVTSRSCN